MTDSAREQLIEAYRLVVQLEDERDRKLEAAARMGELIGGRSPQQVREMEAIQGLG